MLTVDGIIFSLQRHGGITVYFNELLSRLRQHQVAHQTLIFEGTALSTQSVIDHSVMLSSRLGERYRSCTIATACDVFHSSYYRLPNRCTVPVVTTLHDFTYEHFVQGPRQWLHSWQKFRAIRGSQAVICISENTRQDLFHFLPNFPEDRVYVIPNGVGNAFFPIDSAALKTSDCPYVLFVGARGGYKNFYAVVAALSNMPDIRLVCVGGGPLLADEFALVRKQLGNRFNHQKGVSDEALNALYNGAACLLYPSSYEGFGIPVLEAMRAGCPVVALNASSIPEVAGDAAILLEVADPALLVQAIRETLSPERRQILRNLGLARAAKFSWQQTFEKTLKVYERVAGKSIDAFPRK